MKCRPDPSQKVHKRTPNSRNHCQNNCCGRPSNRGGNPSSPGKCAPKKNSQRDYPDPSCRERPCAAVAEYTEYENKYGKDKVWFLRSTQDMLFHQVVSPVAA